MNWKRIIVEAFAGFTGWTLALTPYMLLIIQMSPVQYAAWIVMELILVTPISPVIVKFTEWLLKKLKVIDDGET